MNPEEIREIVSKIKEPLREQFLIHEENDKDGKKIITISKGNKSLCSSDPEDFLNLAIILQETEELLDKSALECKMLGKLLVQFEEEYGEWTGGMKGGEDEKKQLRFYTN